MKKPEDFGIIDYKLINGKLDVYQDVYLSNRNLQEIPFDFNVIYGNFDCFSNKLKVLKDVLKKLEVISIVQKMN